MDNDETRVYGLPSWKWLKMCAWPHKSVDFKLFRTLLNILKWIYMHFTTVYYSNIKLFNFFKCICETKILFKWTEEKKNITNSGISVTVSKTDNFTYTGGSWQMCIYNYELTWNWFMDVKKKFKKYFTFVHYTHKNNCAVKQLFVINRFQNTSFCLHNMCVLCIFIMYI